MKRTYIIIPLFLLALTLGNCLPPAQDLSEQELAIKRKGADSIVIVHSRSGFTAAMGLEIARLMKADYIRLKVAKGAGDNFFSTPNRLKAVETEPAKLDLSPYRVVYLGSPVWYWHQTAFLYSFIGGNDFTGKKVVLFYTCEGLLTDGAVAELKDLVEKKGGVVLDVFGIDRDELDEGQTVTSATSKLVEERKDRWLK